MGTNEECFCTINQGEGNMEDYRYTNSVDYYTTRKGLFEIDREYELKTHSYLEPLETLRLILSIVCYLQH